MSDADVVSLAATALADRLSEDEADILRELHDEHWCRPMDLGASDGSFHSRWLRKLWGLGLAERQDRGGLARARASYVYRRTPLGRAVNATRSATTKGSNDAR